MIALGAVIAERHSRDRLAWIFMEMIVIRGFDLSSYCSRSCSALFPDPADRFLDVGDAD